MSGYTVAVGRSVHQNDGTPAPDRTCGHQHRTLHAACNCGIKLYAAGMVAGSWQANAAWHGWYVVGPDGRRVS